MVSIIEFETNRLKLRQWKNDDYPLFAKINADPVVMEYYPGILNEEESKAWDRYNNTGRIHFSKRSLLKKEWRELTRYFDEIRSVADDAIEEKEDTW